MLVYNLLIKSCQKSWIKLASLTIDAHAMLAFHKSHVNDNYTQRCRIIVDLDGKLPSQKETKLLKRKGSEKQKRKLVMLINYPN
jgi:hypothetical protein